MPSLIHRRDHRLVLLLISTWLLTGFVACRQPPATSTGDGTGTSARQAATGATHTPLPTPTSALPAAAYNEEDQVIMGAIRRNLAEPDLNAQTRHMLDEKLRFLEREVIERATAIALPPLPDNAPEPTQEPVSTPFAPSLTVVPNAGVIVDEGEYPSSQHLTQNSWYIDQGDQRVLAYAGAGIFGEEVADAQQGSVIIVVRQGPEPDGQDKPVVSTDLYVTPTRVGSVRIVGVQRNGGTIRLTLRAVDGSILVFNVTTRVWEAGPGAAGTATPAAPSTSTASANTSIHSHLMP